MANAQPAKYVLKEVELAACGRYVNGSHHWNKHSDETVRRAKEMHAQGMSGPAIAKELGNGVTKQHIYNWVKGKCRKETHIKVIRRVKVKDE